MHQLRSLLQRAILASVFLQLALSNPPVHARHELRLHARQPQFWNWLAPWFSFWGNQQQPSPPSPPKPVQVPPPQPAQVPPPKPVQAPPAQPVQTPPAQPVQAAPTPSAAPSPAPQATQAPLPAPTPVVSLPPSNLSAPSQPSSPSQANQTTGGCQTMRVRREWRKLSVQEQTEYIRAVKCLADLPSQILPGGEYRRYDDFENVHSRMRTKIHWIAPFLPWHRHYMFTYETALRDECGYSGSLPRWDWTLDSKDISKSPVWSPDTNVGFGTNVKLVSGPRDGLDGEAVMDGAFANWPLYYPEYHQLQRNYNLPSQYQQAGQNYGSQFFDASAVRRVDRQTTFQKFAVALEGTDPSSTGPSLPGPHSIIHVIIGGDISPTAYAANEPLFYLHHSQVDYLWWRWQNAQPNRKRDYGGPVTRGSTRNEARLTDRLQYLGITPDLTVQDTMDTSAAPYCYKYE